MIEMLMVEFFFSLYFCSGLQRCKKKKKKKKNTLR